MAKYHSPTRERQAEETRKRMVDAAREIFLAKGYDGTTIEAIAAGAGVAPQTVYAAFQSKAGILVAILRGTVFGPRYQELVRQAMATADPVLRLPFAAKIARQIYDAFRAEWCLLQGAGIVTPELQALERQGEHARYEAQAPMIAYLAEQGRLRPGLDVTAAREILWAFTSRDFYRMLVVERGWSADRYEQWLGEVLVSTLLAPSPASPTSS